METLTSTPTITPSLYQGMMKPRTNGRELSRLITAAVVNQGFCNMLLANPERALASGFNGEAFCLETEDQNFVLSIQASNLAEFAMQLAVHHNHKHNDNGNRRKL